MNNTGAPSAQRYLFALTLGWSVHWQLKRDARPPACRPVNPYGLQRRELQATEGAVEKGRRMRAVLRNVDDCMGASGAAALISSSDAFPSRTRGSLGRDAAGHSVETVARERGQGCCRDIRPRLAGAAAPYRWRDCDVHLGSLAAPGPQRRTGLPASVLHRRL